MKAPNVETRFSVSQPSPAWYVYTRRGIPASPVMCIGKNATLKPVKMSPNTQQPMRSDSACLLQ